MNNDENTLTQEQVKTVYETLDKVEDTDKLTDANKEPYLDNETKIEYNAVGAPQPIGEEVLYNMGLDDDTIESLKDIKVDPIDPKSIQISDKELIEVFSPYGISDTDTVKLIDIITKYRNNEEFDMYEALPENLKVMVESMRYTDSGKVSKKTAAKFVIDSFINDAKIGTVLDEYSKELNETMAGMNKDFQYIVQDSIQDVYDKIDNIRETDPEQAAKIEMLYSAFKDSSTFERQLSYLNTVTAKKLNKFTSRFESECIYFNTKANAGEIKVPKLESLLPIIKRALNGFTEIQIKKFLVVISKSIYDLDMHKVEDIAYVYRMIANISSFEFNTEFDSEYAKELFGNIIKVIQKIIALEDK